ncbi:MAG: HDOD domain-containing protein [Planctomycetes bacterium]|nr:HDOD domain-containing protein [Planctomycetota bacterium]
MAKDLKSIVSQIDDLPSLPQVVTTIIALINDPTSNAEDLNRALERDPAMVGRILKLVNSAFYGLSNRVSSVRQAIVLLGFSTVRSLALSAAIFDFFGQPRSVKFSRVAFWAHLVAVAGLSRLIASREAGLAEEPAFVVGLLHDIGKLVLDRYVQQDFQHVLEVAQKKKCTFLDAEHEVLDTDHSEIGRWLAERWALPDELVSAIGYHHCIAESPENFRRLTAIVSFADFLSYRKNVGSPGSYASPELDPDAWSLLTIRKEDLPTIAAEVDAELASSEKLFGLVVT